MLAPVLLLSQVIGRAVLGADRSAVGRLSDLIVRVDGDSAPTAVERLVITRRNSAILLLPWQEVTGVGDGQLTLGTSDLRGFEIGSLGEALRPGEILLARDVLDTQVVDVVGQRLARVADVVLVPAGGSRLEVAGVEVGFGAVLRRLGLGRLIPNPTGDIIAWTDLHLTSDRGHAVQLASPRSAVHLLDARGLAALVSRVDTDAASEILAGREPGMAAEVVAHAHPEVGERMLRALPGEQSDRIVAAMPDEHARRWRRLLRMPGTPGRRFLRSPVWSRRHLNWRRP